MKPSDYLIATAKQNIEGSITIDEVKLRIDTYYQQQAVKNDKDRTEEADKVSARIAEILSEDSFAFSPAEYLSIHRRLFQGIYSHRRRNSRLQYCQKRMGVERRNCFIRQRSKFESYFRVRFRTRKKFSYKGLTRQEIVEHIAHFISYLWQIHVFGEGNTRTTALFLIRYLRKLGFKEVNNDLFAEHSRYFRNALVRANYEDLSKGIHKTEQYLIRFLLNLLLKENHPLKNREMHIHYIDTVNDTVKLKNDTVNDTIFDLIKKNNHITAVEISEKLKISLSTSKRRIKALKEQGKIKRIGSDKTGDWKAIE